MNSYNPKLEYVIEGMQSLSQEGDEGEGNFTVPFSVLKYQTIMQDSRTREKIKLKTGKVVGLAQTMPPCADRHR